MTDDDFESVFRKMIEHFMGSMGLSPEGEISVRTWTNMPPDRMSRVDDTPVDDGMQAEEIDLGESYIILIDSKGSPNPPVISIEGHTIRVAFEELEQTFTTGFDIDIETSTASYRNGILELILQKNKSGTPGTISGTIHVE